MNDIKRIDGPSCEPVSGMKPKQIVIFCHGLGSDGSDLIGLASYFSKTLPDAIFFSPNAPFPFDLAPIGHQWFSLENSSPASRIKGVRSAAPILDKFIDEKIELFELTEKQVALVGFSQGAMLALHVSLRRASQLAGVIGYSGALVGEDLLRTEVVSRPPILLVHGDMDNIVPPDSLQHTVAALQGAGIQVNSEMRPGLGHSLDDRGIMLGMDFLAHCFDVTLISKI